MKKSKLTLKEKSWILYDCGNSAYSMAITTAIFPVYFGMVNKGSSMDYGYFASISHILVALISPMLGTIADYKDFKKRFFLFFAFLGVGMTGLLSIAPVKDSEIIVLIIIYVFSAIGFAGANVFYDAFLVDITDNERMDSVSTKGFAFGYILSVIPFTISLLVIFLLGMGNTLGYQLGFIITSLWWGLFTIPMIRNVNQVHYINREPQIILNSFRRIIKTFMKIKKYKIVFIFLLAYFVYIDGVDTIINMAVPYSKETLGLASNDTFTLLGILLLINIIAFPFAILYGILAKKYSSKRMIVVAIVTYIFSVIFAFFMTELWHIFILGTLIGSAQGGIQALSRSYFAKIIPKNNANEFFGFYNIFGKFAAIIGPFLMSLTSDIFKNARVSILSIIPLFFIGLLIFLRLPNEVNTETESIE